MLLPFGTTAPASNPSPTTSGTGGFWGVTVVKPTVTVANAGNISTNNSIKAVVFTLPYATTVTGVALDITALLNPSTVDVALYNATTGVGILNTNGSGFGGSGLSGATTGVKSATFTKVTVPAGQYLLAWSGTSSGTMTTLGWFIAGSANTTNADTIANAINGQYFTSTDTATSGILPSSLTIAHLTKGTGGFDPPAVWFAS